MSSRSEASRPQQSWRARQRSVVPAASGAHPQGADFSADALRFGSLRCFRHFTCALRGREELVVTVPSCDARRLLALHTPGSLEACAEDTPVSACFLLAAYSRYSSSLPYCWLRSTSCDLPHETAERSSLPLELHTTQCWRERGFRVFDIVQELVTKVASPRPANAFAVDHDALARLPDGERALMSGALVHFLSELGTPAVQSDLALLLSSHFSRGH